MSAALLAMTGCGEYPDIFTAVKSTVKTCGRIMPDARAAAAYDKRYAVYRKLYPALKPIYADFDGLRNS